jgi:hypothetical protein
MARRKGAKNNPIDVAAKPQPTQDTIAREIERILDEVRRVQEQAERDVAELDHIRKRLENNEISTDVLDAWCAASGLLKYMGGNSEPPPIAYSDIAAEEARRGNPAALIGYIRLGGVLSPAAAEVVVDALTTKPGSRYKTVLKDAAAYRAAFDVGRRGGKKDLAVGEVAKEQKQSTSTVYRMLRRLPKP